MENRMNTLKKLILIASVLISLLFTPHHTHTMDQPNKEIGWVALAGAAIIGGYAAYQQFLSYIHGETTEPLPSIDLPEDIQPTEPFPFTKLPKEMQLEIISALASNSTAKTLQEAAKTIRALAVTNKYLNESINNPQFCLQIVKHLSQRFDCANDVAAAALQTIEGKKRFAIQGLFE